MIIQPKGDNIIIKLEQVASGEQVVGGIIIPASSNPAMKQDKGTVVAVGRGRLLNSGEIIPPDVEEGDYVIFNKFAGTEIVVGDEMFLIVKENDILAKI